MVAVVALVAAAFFVGRSSKSSSGDHISSTNSEVATGFAKLPTVKCNTGQGVIQPAVQLEPTTTVPLPASLAARLAAYRDSAGTTVIAPVGFDCEAGIGVDGSEHVTAFPKGKRNPAEYPQTSGTVVTIDIARACQGCIAEAICTFFPEAKPVGYYYGGIEGEECPEKPLHEEVAYTAKSTVIFSDPPHVNGSAVGSGGADPSLGALSYLESIGVRKVSCTLPKGQADACGGIVAATLAGAPLGG